MRHLIVPSKKTAEWLSKLRSNGWLMEGTGVIRIDDDFRAIALSQSAPTSSDDYEGLEIIDMEAKLPGPKSWQNRLSSNTIEKIGKFLPNSYEVQGDVLIVKLEPEVLDFADEIGNAFLEQLNPVRVVCRDDGVQGEFRVRKLTPIVSRNQNNSTDTVIREHGIGYHTNPAKAYFSARLGTERLESAHHCLRLHSDLQRNLVIYDPYAGVGPNLGLPISDGIVDRILAGDLNPSAAELLEKNLQVLNSKFSDFTFEAICADALEWSKEPKYCEKADVLFVNIPHSTLNHLPKLLPLLKRKSQTLVRGWLILEREELQESKEKIESLFNDFGALIHEIDIEEAKGFSTTKCFTRLTIYSTIE